MKKIFSYFTPFAVIFCISYFFSCTSDTSEPVTYCVIESIGACAIGLTGKQCREEGYKGYEGYFDTECPSSYDKIIIAGSSSSNGNSSINSSSSSVPSHSELCAIKPITKECLAGRWSLEKVEGGNSECNPNKNINNSLKLQANGQFSFVGGYNVYLLETFGNWELNNSVMKINCIGGECDLGIAYPIDANIEIRNSGSELRLTSNGYTTFSQCKLSGNTKLTEVFSWQGD